MSRKSERLGRRIGKLERSVDELSLNQGGRDVAPNFLFRSTERVDVSVSVVAKKKFPSEAAIMFDRNEVES